MKYLGRLSPFLLLLAAACASQSTPQPGTPNPPFTTPLPSVTALPFPSSTFTPTAIPVTPTPTSDPERLAAIEALRAGSQPDIFTYDSPSGIWQAEIAIYGCTQATGQGDDDAYEELSLVQVASGASTPVDGRLYTCQGLGAFGLEGLFWSPNSRYFYYTDARQGSPDGGCYYWEPSVLRVDTVEKTTETLGPGPRSPDETKLATWREEELIIRDLDAGELGRVRGYLGKYSPGPVAWSPGGDAIAYLQSSTDCFGLPGGTSYLVLVTLPGLESALLLESAENLTSLAWATPDEIILTSADRREWRYNLTTRELIEP